MKKRKSKLDTKRNIKRFSENWNSYLGRKIDAREKDAKEKGYGWHVDSIWLKDLIKRQNYKCAVTGLDMTHVLGKSMYWTTCKS